MMNSYQFDIKIPKELYRDVFDISRKFGCTMEDVILEATEKFVEETKKKEAEE